jgi:CheY-like chemotaxis protein
MRNLARSAVPLTGKGRRAASRDGRRRARLLIAEDDWAFRDMLVWAFDEEGCEVVSVGSGADLLYVLASSMLPRSGVGRFDLVVSDLSMPGWSGLPAIESLGKNPLLPPIVVITAFGSDEVQERARRAGAAAVLDKPFDIRRLLGVARDLLARPAV